MYYHNSYLLADPQEAWVLETVDRQWAARRIEDIYSISNGLTIASDWDRASDGLVEFAMEKSWCRSADDFNFARDYSDFLYTRFSNSTTRRKRTMDILKGSPGRIGVDTVISALRDHGDETERSYRPDKGITQQTVCAHATLGPVRVAQTTGSLIALLHPETPPLFVTATSAPCTSIFKPIWVDTQLLDMGPTPTGSYNVETLFWKHELLHRVTLSNYPSLIEEYKHDRDRLEREFIEGAFSIQGSPPGARSEYSRDCFAKAAEAEAEWLDRIKQLPSGSRQSWYHKLAWNNCNKTAGMTQALNEFQRM